MTPTDHARFAAAALADAAEQYHGAQRVLSPALALRATAAEMVRVLATVDPDATPDEVARALAVALGSALRDPNDPLTKATIARLRATADWLEDASVRRKEAA